VTILLASRLSPSVVFDLIPEPRRALVEEASHPSQQLVLGYWREPLERPADEVQSRFTETFSHITVPYSAIFGDRVEPDYRRWLSGVVPQARIVEFPDSGHFPHLVDPVRAARVIRELAASAADAPGAFAEGRFLNVYP
jgi:pimeloyl-ACP methyl ester carboxylesterase